MPIRRFLRNLLLAVPLVFAVWLLITPFYNRFLITAGGNFTRLLERPDVTELIPRPPHHAMVLRRDLGRQVYSLRITDYHFHLVLLGALMLAVPGVPGSRKWANLGWSVLILVFFHIALIYFWTRFIYATQMGPWSVEHYGPAARETLGVAKHVLDLPIKLALPLVLWAAFYLRELLPRTAPAGTR